MRTLIVVFIFLFGVVSFFSCSKDKDKECMCRYTVSEDGVFTLDSTSLYPGNSHTNNIDDNDEEAACNFFDMSETFITPVDSIVIITKVECELE